eukprot:GHVU01039289.1.p1 GENE.GHVU01039289.1~~GHVU01039289.1.p1  ORF type:complete len:184 (-),score=28.25 GHVU01039289.1:66-617(-)
MSSVPAVVEQNRSVFPIFKVGDSYELWSQLCEAVKDNHPRFLGLSGEALARFESNQLFLAVEKHVEASTEILAALRERAEETTSEAWLQKVKEILKRTCEPLDRDAEKQIRMKLDALPRNAEAQFGGNVRELLHYFRVLRSEARKYKVTYTDATLADILIRSSPRDLQNLLRLQLKDDQTKPE